MLAGLLLLLDERGHAVRRAALAGALFGAAAALKYSNATFALAALPLAAAMPGLRGAARWRACLGYIGGGALMVAVLAGPWFALLLREFGNPVFPLMNGWFRSPDAPPVNMVGARFTVGDLADAGSALPSAWCRSTARSIPRTSRRTCGLPRCLPQRLPCARWRALRGPPAVASLKGPDWRLFAFFCHGAGAVAGDLGQCPLWPGGAAPRRRLSCPRRRAPAAAHRRAHRARRAARAPARHDAHCVAVAMVRRRAVVDALAALRGARTRAARAGALPQRWRCCPWPWSRPRCIPGLHS